MSGFEEKLDKNAKTMMQICEQTSKICEPCKLRETVGCDKADCIVNMRRFVGVNSAVAEHNKAIKENQKLNDEKIGACLRAMEKLHKERDEQKQKLQEILKRMPWQAEKQCREIEELLEEVES